MVSKVRASVFRSAIPVHYAQSARGRGRGGVSRSPEDLSPSLPSGKITIMFVKIDNKSIIKFDIVIVVKP